MAMTKTSSSIATPHQMVRLIENTSKKTTALKTTPHQMGCPRVRRGSSGSTLTIVSSDANFRSRDTVEGHRGPDAPELARRPGVRRACQASRRGSLLRAGVGMSSTESLARVAGAQSYRETTAPAISPSNAERSTSAMSMRAKTPLSAAIPQLRSSPLLSFHKAFRIKAFIAGLLCGYGGCDTS
jgi:hypothetical protein